MTSQLDMFNEVELAEPEPTSTVRLGHREAQIPLRKQRREACTRLLEILAELEGKDVYLGVHETGRHFWISNAKMGRLQISFFPPKLNDDANWIPSVIILWGNRGGQVRIDTRFLVAVREQDYQGYWHYLLDFRNGFYESRIEEWHSHYACLSLTKFKD